MVLGSGEYTRSRLNSDFNDLKHAQQEAESDPFEYWAIKQAMNQVMEKLSAIYPVASDSTLTPKTSSHDFYFYQASDGQYAFLSPFDVRVLREEYHHYDRFPLYLSATVENIQESIMTQVRAIIISYFII